MLSLMCLLSHDVSSDLSRDLLCDLSRDLSNDLSLDLSYDHIIMLVGLKKCVWEQSVNQFKICI